MTHTVLKGDAVSSMCEEEQLLAGFWCVSLLQYATVEQTVQKGPAVNIPLCIGSHSS